MNKQKAPLLLFWLWINAVFNRVASALFCVLASHRLSFMLFATPKRADTYLWSAHSLMRRALILPADATGRALPLLFIQHHHALQSYARQHCLRLDLFYIAYGPTWPPILSIHRFRILSLVDWMDIFLFPLQDLSISFPPHFFLCTCVTLGFGFASVHSSFPVWMISQ